MAWLGTRARGWLSMQSGAAIAKSYVVPGKSLLLTEDGDALLLTEAGDALLLSEAA